MTRNEIILPVDDLPAMAVLGGGILGRPVGPLLHALGPPPGCPTRHADLKARSRSKSPTLFHPKSRIRLGTHHLTCLSQKGRGELVPQLAPQCEVGSDHETGTGSC